MLECCVSPGLQLKKLEKDDEYDLLCIFDLQPFVDPVRADDGRTYSRANIEKYFVSQETQGKPIISPWTRGGMSKRLVPDNVAAKAIEKRRMGRIDFKALIPGARSIHDLGDVFATLDSVRDVLADFLDGWQPPQLVMVGKESSGKSSVLERLCMMPIFPRADNVCTRTPIHVRLRNSMFCEAATLEVFNTKTKCTEDGPHIIPTETGEKSFLPHRTQSQPKMQRRRAGDILDCTGAIDVKAKMDEVLQKEGNQRLSIDRIIIIKITNPYVPSIDLIDMPGLVTSRECAALQMPWAYSCPSFCEAWTLSLSSARLRALSLGDAQIPVGSHEPRLCSSLLFSELCVP